MNCLEKAGFTELTPSSSAFPLSRQGSPIPGLPGGTLLLGSDSFVSVSGSVSSWEWFSYPPVVGPPPPWPDAQGMPAPEARTVMPHSWGYNSSNARGLARQGTGNTGSPLGCSSQRCLLQRAVLWTCCPGCGLARAPAPSLATV